MFTTIPPKGDFIQFNDENELFQKTKDWGLVSASAKTPKHEFAFKRGATAYTVAIKGYELNGDHETAVISFSNDALHCIHPSYLKEMQSPSFGKESMIMEAEPAPDNELPEEGNVPETKILTTQRNEKETKKKTAKPKIDLPSEKVSFQATVKEFTTKYNPFNETEDEIMVLEHVKIVGDQQVDVGEAWCGYSNTLKKAELEVGQAIKFDAKIVDRKLNKDIRYKINNPSKLTKITE
ncbi:hypothetical protein [Peribacillus sp. SCS-155]|uniref:hypothetical protein n=1 Tax=Peribacillus sedimenti TaxID=3115297 RepID=UPI00390658BA